ncbi:MAG: hypothetical protein GEU73_14980, partial [Chloroflexi bacterium]|nr:hypothetical protein [Chloroflexota bacterium]
MIAYVTHPHAPVVTCIGALLLWLVALSSVQIRDVSDLGLVAVLPAGAFVALGLLLLSYALALRQQPLRTHVLLLHVGTLIFMLYGATTVVSVAPRFTIAWRHVGVAEYIARTGTVAPLIDAYHNWPGFFALIAFVSDVAGFDSAIHLAPWAPVVFNLLYLCPLIVILRTAAVDERTVWIGVWFFCLTNWIGQDYLAPQALSFFLYLVVLAVILV